MFQHQSDLVFQQNLLHLILLNSLMVLGIKLWSNIGNDKFIYYSGYLVAKASVLPPIE
jgi:hypothetical protein